MPCRVRVRGFVRRGTRGASRIGEGWSWLSVQEGGERVGRLGRVFLVDPVAGVRDDDSGGVLGDFFGSQYHAYCVHERKSVTGIFYSLGIFVAERITTK